MFGYIFMDFYVSVLFIFHIGLIYYYRFYFLKFLITVEMSLILIYICIKLLVRKCEVAFLLLYLSVIACEAAVGLAILVRWVRFNDKYNVKSNVFSDI
jgi:NADH:ubiquinone oxidoreductase subunit K